MRFDTVSLTPTLVGAIEAAQLAEAQGFDGWGCAETGHDVMLLTAMAARETTSIHISSAIAVAFARNPMSLAYQANDIQGLSEGRFTLGLGTQIKPHITRRFSMEWSKPAARMREYVLALGTIFRHFNEDGPLDHEGEFYTHNLTNPFFRPEPHDFGAPPIHLAAVGPLMTRTAAEVADGVLCHAFTTRDYFDAVTMPALVEGADRGDRDLAAVDVAVGVFVVTGRDDEERAAARAAVTSQLAFYGSTPAYRPVLEQHGWGDVQAQLARMSKQGQWLEMADLITDDMLDVFALVVDDPDRVGDAYLERWGDVVSQASLYPTWTPDDQARTAIQASFAAC